MTTVRVCVGGIKCDEVSVQEPRVLMTMAEERALIESLSSYLEYLAQEAGYYEGLGESDSDDREAELFGFL